MKRFFLALCFISFVSIGIYSQNNDSNNSQLTNDEYELSHRRELCKNNKSVFEKKTIDKIENLKQIVGKEICLRPDYEYENLKIVWSHKVPFLGDITEHFKINASDVLTVEKTTKGRFKKPALMVRLNEDKFRIDNFELKYFMVVSDRDKLLMALEEQDRKAIENAEMAKRAEEEAAMAALKANLDEYYKSINEMHELNNGPIVVNHERAYDGTKPYRKCHFSTSDFDSFKDEKFVINQRIFKRDFQKLLEKVQRDDKAYYPELQKLSTMQADTFGLFKNARDFINLRTGDIFRGYQLTTISLWESTTYMDNLNALPPVKYDATVSMHEFLGGMDRPYRERYIDALIGERVFLLDDLKYDTITDIEEYYGSYGNTSILYFQNHEPMKEWKDKCISVKWYEKLQDMIGKKVVKAGDIRFYGFDDISTTWKEDLKDLETYTIEKFELTKGKFLIYLSGRTPESVFECCDFLTYPINIDNEWKNEMLGQKSELKGFIPYDLVFATTPNKPNNVKRQEAEDNAWAAEVSKQFSDLRNHKYIGTSLENFLQKWPSAQLVNTTNSNGNIIKVYSVNDLQFEYQIIFKNNVCVSQTKLQL